MPILNVMFSKAFGQEEANKHMIVDHGWNPLNRKLLEHPSINDGEKPSLAYSPPPHAPLPPLNFEHAEGIGASVLDSIKREWAKNEGARQAALKHQEEGYNIKQNIKDYKKVSSGLLAKNEAFVLDNPSFVEELYEGNKCTKQETIDKAKNRQKLRNTNKHVHEFVHMLQKFTLAECAAYL